MTTTDSLTTSVRQHTVQQSMPWRSDRHRRHTDVLVVHPAEADSGVRFQRHGTESAAGSIAAHWDAVIDTRGGIVLGNNHGLSLRGAIPLLAALRVAGVDNAIVEVQGSRIPAEVRDFDFYLDMLANVGVQAQAAARQLLCVTDTVEVRDRFGALTLSPAVGFRACVKMPTIDADGCGNTACAALVSDFTESSAAISNTSHAGLHDAAGNARESLALREVRFLPEPLRATLVEMIGYLALAGAPVAANVYGHSSGSRHYQALLHALMERRAVTLTTVDAHRGRQRTATNTDVDAATQPGCGSGLC